MTETRTWNVDIRAICEGTVNVEASSEEEALALGEDRGLERDDYFEMRDFTATGASPA